MNAPHVEFDNPSFRKAMGQFPTGIVIVTTIVEGKPVGLSAQSFVSLSMDPPLISFSPAHTSRTGEKIRQTACFAVNILSEHQENISRVFGSKIEDKFAQLEWETSPAGNPIFPGSLHWLDAELTEVFPAGDHSIFVARVTNLGPTIESRPLLFFRGGYLTTQEEAAQLVIESPDIRGEKHILKDS